MRALLEDLVDLLIPPQCCRCERWLLPRNPRDAVLCESCRAAAPWIEPGLCIGCQERPPRASSRRCADCGPEDGSGARALASCTASVRYEAEVVDWIARFKYPAPGLAGLDAAARGIVRLLAREAVARCPASPPRLVVPVPSHRRRFASRGFEPSAVVAREIARAAGAPLEVRALARERDTPSQTGLDRHERRSNVAGAFAPRRPVAKRVWLVDDVVTTGATLDAAARALRLAGAEEIHALALARTPAPRERTR